jgi:hypothetical protein
MSYSAATDPPAQWPLQLHVHGTHASDFLSESDVELTTLNADKPHPFEQQSHPFVLSPLPSKGVPLLHDKDSLSVLKSVRRK